MLNKRNLQLPAQLLQKGFDNGVIVRENWSRVYLHPVKRKSCKDSEVGAAKPTKHEYIKAGHDVVAVNCEEKMDIFRAFLIRKIISG